MIDIVVEKVGGFRLRLQFSDGSEGERDFAAIVAGGPMVEPLRDPAFFARIFMELGTLTWLNHFDVDSIAVAWRDEGRRSLAGQRGVTTAFCRHKTGAGSTLRKHFLTRNQ